MLSQWQSNESKRVYQQLVEDGFQPEWIQQCQSVYDGYFPDG